MTFIIGSLAFAVNYKRSKDKMIEEKIEMKIEEDLTTLKSSL